MAAKKSVLVVGHGPIGHSFIEKLVERHADFEISVLCEEPRPAYNRVMLTQYFENKDADKHDAMKLSYVSEAELKELSVKLIYGRAIAIDREARSVSYTMLGKGEEGSSSVSYDVLVLATGSFCFVPPVPGMTLPEKKNVHWPDDPASRPEGVFVYRTIEDLEGLLTAAKAGATRAVVIGGGLLGLEAAKAVYDLKMESHVLEMAPYLMPTQLNEPAGTVLTQKIQALGISVHVGVQIKEIVHTEDGKVRGIRILEKGADEPVLLECDLVVVSCGVRPRDSLAGNCGLELGARGGVKVDASLRSSDEHIYAIGEVAAIGGTFCYGLWGPGVEQAEALVKNLVDGPGSMEYTSSDLSTKLKLLGVEVASFGRTADFWFKRQFDGKDPEVKSLECRDEVSGTYRRLCFSADGSKLMGGILIGDAKDYSKLLQLSKKADLGGNDAAGLTYGRPPPGAANQEAVDGGDGTGLADDDLICSCLALSKATVRKTIIELEAHTIPQIKKCCKAGTGCGGCVAPVGEVPKLLAHTLKKLGKDVDSGVCTHFVYSRRELFDIVKVKELKSFDDVMAAAGKGADGCELCKPVVASILSSLWNDHALKGGLDQIQDTNDRFLGNIQKTGTYSIIPRCAGGDISPDTLIAFASTAKKYGLWTKITGAQRLGMYGAPMHQLPDIFKELVDAGMETGQAYGKALRTVKSCVGTSWCRYGQQDSVTMAVSLENRYKGLRAPHKFKMAVSGCLRECAEAQGKDVGLIATQAGYNLYVCGNGGVKPVHAKLLANDCSEEECFKYIDRFLMFYISTAKHLQRTSPWLAELEGGIEYLKKVVINDGLGLGAELEAMMQRNRMNFHCEWKEVAYDDELRKKFAQFANSAETKDSEQIEYIDVRGQRHPNNYSPPDILGPALYNKTEAPEQWEWIFAGNEADFPRNGGLAVKHGSQELAVFYLPAQSLSDQWLATQNLCPHKQARSISRGLTGELASGMLTLADPVYKTTYDLRSGAGIGNPNFNLSTFQTKVENGRVLVKVPPKEEMEEAFELQISQAYSAAGKEYKKRGHGAAAKAAATNGVAKAAANRVASADSNPAMPAFVMDW
ncbi:unnamed protein product [Polarella glacialis]|uniref:Rieske domain-containing protein n=1 Tax=Polarella glacialis TaxID=89957 RepID=A0A813E020_POLGL|nr:unnamed protein product [Polarella glacialis]